jgi:hypothetical protein
MYEESTSYLTRITVLRSYAALAQKVEGSETITSISAPLMEQIVNMLLKGLKDGVANVRLISARGLGIVNVSGQCDDAIMNGHIIPALTECVSNEEDADCKYQCQLALEAKA